MSRDSRQVADKRSLHYVFASILLTGILTLGLTGCQTIKLSGSPNAQNPSAPNSTGNNATSVDMSGPWQVSYEVGGEPKSAHMTLNQTGATFQGTGTDDHDSQNFVIDKGSIAGTSITFHKRYHVDENPNLPPIIYQGTFEMAKTETYSGPYASGTYSLTKGGQTVGGRWDAQKEGLASPTPAQDTPPANTQVNPAAGNKAPHLSGKWDAGYEFEFKTVHSSIYLEQEGQKLVGHGIDKNSKETFTLSGNYKFPNIRFVLKYNAVKGPKGKAKPERKLEFRGTVANVNESEYQGPRLEGKTNGGGAWMAEIVK
ncbi:MAG: hypothetical protein IPM93_29600 [Candidatus Obscuribacter sp.]|nr:hypothetical protein [Candidatus Obscuribacter sp.]